MGFLDKFLNSNPRGFNPEDLELPEIIQTNVPGKTLKKSDYTQAVEIEIVGESFRAKNIATISTAANGSEFDIYLIPEPTNQYDKKAVAVYAANLHIGYIAKPGNTQWFKWVKEALDENICLWGRAKTISRSGTNNIGVFGHIKMPESGKEITAIIPIKLSESELKKLLETIKKLANNIEEPETISQLRSGAKKIASEAKITAAHAKALVTELDADDPLIDHWNEILEICSDLMDTARDATYAVDVDDFDITSGIYDLAGLLEEVVGT